MASSASLPAANLVAASASQSSELPHNPPFNAIAATSSMVNHSATAKARQSALATEQFDLLRPIRNYLDALPVEDEGFARLLYQVIPGQCPFARDIVLFGRTVAHIPPLCKLNPFYEQVVGLRFRAMCYLVDECGVAL